MRWRYSIQENRKLVVRYYSSSAKLDIYSSKYSAGFSVTSVCRPIKALFFSSKARRLSWTESTALRTSMMAHPALNSRSAATEFRKLEPVLCKTSSRWLPRNAAISCEGTVIMLWGSKMCYRCADRDVCVVAVWVVVGKE